MSTEITYAMDRAPSVDAVQRLFAHTDWATGRRPADVAAMLANTTAHATAWQADTLVAYARALSDGCFRAWIDDVVVAPGLRRRGVGRRLVAQLLDHLGDIEEIYLACDDAVIPFYAAHGFTHDAGPVLIRRLTD